MAEALSPAASPGTIAVLEETVHLLRRAPVSTLLCHWAGSIPFAAGLLVFWNDLTSVRLSDQRCALEALGLAVLLLWMNCWRAVFAGRLRRQLSGAANPRWTGRRALNLVASQSAVGAAKLVVLPVAALVCFPFASTVAFFRNAAVLSDRDDLDAPQLIAKARRLASVHAGQSWAVLPLLALLALVTAANLALTFALLPFLVRMLTGAESEFNRAGMFFVESPLFLILVLVSTWLFLDPFVQALYVVRCFHGESVATGDDLRVGLRRIRGAKVMAALAIGALAIGAQAIGAAAPTRAADAVTEKQLEDSVHRVMTAPEYDWRIPPPPPNGAGSRPWVLHIADKILEVLNGGWRAILKGIGKVLEWIFGRLQNSPVPGQGSAPAAGLNWTLWLLLGAIAAVMVWVAWRRQIFRRRGARGAVGTVTAALRLDEEGVTADQLPEERWIELALDCLRREEYRPALRAYYLASLAWLGQRGFIAIHAGKTNREYELELRRKARQFAEARALFGANISSFEAVWYGMHEASGASVEEFRARMDGMKRVMA
jgi:hypothetical protein